MDYVSANIMMEMLEQTVDSVNGLEISADVIPALGVVPFGTRFGVMQEGYDNQPGTVDEEGDSVVSHEFGKAEANSACNEEGGHGGPARYGDKNHGALLLCEKL